MSAPDLLPKLGQSQCVLRSHHARGLAATEKTGWENTEKYFTAIFMLESLSVFLLLIDIVCCALTIWVFPCLISLETLL